MQTKIRASILGAGRMPGIRRASYLADMLKGYGDDFKQVLQLIRKNEFCVQQRYKKMHVHGEKLSMQRIQFRFCSVTHF